MRILQVVHGFPPNEWAGTELVTLHLSQALRERGHEVTVLTRVYDTQSAEGTLCETRYENLPVFQLVNNYTASATFRQLYDNPLYNGPFLQVLKQVRPDVVHVQHTQHLSVSLVRLAPALGYPTVLSFHDFFFACHRIHLIDAQQRLCPGPEQGERCVTCLQALAGADDVRRRFAEVQRTLRAPDVLLTPSGFLAQKMQAYFPLLRDKFRSVPLGVDPVAEAYCLRSSRSPEMPLRLLYVGVLAPHKGAHILLEALKGFPPDKVEVSLYGVESPQQQAYIDQLRAVASELPAKFCGTYQHDHLGAILQQHDLLVMPMIWEETFSLLTREALLAGLPVIAARRGAVVEAVHDDVNGLLFEAENPHDLRRCLTRFLVEPDLLDRLRAAKPTVKTQAAYAQDIEEIYRKVIRSRSHDQDRSQSDTATVEAPVLRSKGVHESPAKVSVCIPTYNGSAFLAESITSVLSQSLQDFEVLIVDDCSSDTTVEIARSFHDPRIVIHRNDRQLGIPGNWNRCLELARGEYVTIFHQDDVMLPENLAQKVRLLDATPAINFVHSAVEFLVDATAPPPSQSWVEFAEENFTVAGHEYFRKLLLRGNLICAPTVVARRQRLLDAGKFDEELGYTPDYEMWLKLCVSGQVAYLSQPLLLYRWHEKNASHLYRFTRGVAELQLAGHRALQYCERMTGKHAEQKTLTEVMEALGDLRQWAATLEQGKEWMAQQASNWQRATQERDLVIQEQKAWIVELEEGKTWLDGQRMRWQQVAEHKEAVLQEQQKTIEELQTAKLKLEEQGEAWKAEAERWRAQLEAQIKDWENQLWTRIGIRLGTVKPSLESKDD